ncbi:MAG: hypothetical protein ED557_01320 [Balneola sp.]|nr:MAG: hypothetical protein ED557_01320 [Balneola sp.]
MMKKILLPALLSIFLITISSAQERRANKEGMKLIYSSDWDWDWHCNCRLTYDYKKKRNQNRRSYHTRYRYYHDEGVDNEFDFFSNIGPNPAIYGFSPSVQAIHYNRVNSLFIGVDTEFEDFTHNFTDIYGFEVQALGGYSIGREEWQYQLGLEKPIGRKVVLGADIHNIVTTEDSWRTGLTENTISSLVLGYDFHDYYKAEGYSFYGSIRAFDFTYLGVSYNTDTFNSVDAITGYNIYGDGNIERLNPAIDPSADEIFHQSIGLSLNINPRLYQYSRNFTTSLVFRGEIGNYDGNNNDFEFNKFIAQSNTIFRLDRSTFLKWRLMGGAITGEAPAFKQFALGGIGTMRATDYKDIQGNTMVLSNAELVFGRTSDLDFGFFELDGFYVSLFMDSGWAEFNNRLITESDPTIGFENFAVSEFTHNVGFGVGGDMFRLEFAKPLSDSGGLTAVWIRLNPTF